LETADSCLSQSRLISVPLRHTDQHPLEMPRLTELQSFVVHRNTPVELCEDETRRLAQLLTAFLHKGNHRHEATFHCSIKQHTGPKCNPVYVASSFFHASPFLIRRLVLDNA
jgi:hypothetical protein